MELIFATHNNYKAEEITKMLNGQIQVQTLDAIGCHDEIPETADTLDGNALQKAQFVHDRYNKNVFADDTGLEIEALNGRPGVFSARFAGDNPTFDDNMNKVLKEMEGISNRKARFRTVIALILNKEIYYFEGMIEGHILKSKTGDEGFGYDPIFQPVGYDQSFAEMPLPEKNKISHRGKAMEKFVEFLLKKN